MAGGAGPARGGPRPERRGHQRRHGRDPRRRRDAGAARWVHRGAAHEGRDRRRADRAARRHARGRRPRACRRAPPRPARRHRRHRRRSQPFDQRVHHRLVRRGGGRRARLQARQPGRLVGVWGRRSPRGARCRARARPRRHRPVPGDGRAGVLLRASVPLGAAPRRSHPRRAGRADGVQHPRAHGQPGPRPAARGRARRRVSRRTHARRAGPRGRPPRADRARRRRPRRAHDDHDVDGLGARRRGRPHVDARSGRARAGPGPARRPGRRATRPPTPPTPGPCWRASRGPHRDIVVLNAAAGLLVGGAVGSLAEGVELAGAVLDDGRAAAALDAMAAASRAST